MPSEVVVKVGGSLFDLPVLGIKLRTWLDALPARHALLVPGGGAAADLVRQADTLDQLGEERCHWLALRALQFQAHLLAARLPGGRVIDRIEACKSVWQRGDTPILDVYAFAVADEALPGHLPHHWAVTSDSLAARVAFVAGISALVLLKSCDLPGDGDWLEAAGSGIVDSTFSEVVRSAGCQLHVAVVNFRTLCR